jgi:hypothetical protein
MTTPVRNELVRVGVWRIPIGRFDAFQIRGAAAAECEVTALGDGQAGGVGRVRSGVP